MTGTTKFALVHLFHHPALITTAGTDNRIVTIVATVALLLVNLVTEIDIACADRQFIANGLGIPRVAFLAVGLDSKGGIVVVAGTTGLSLLHLGHCAVLVAGTRNKERWMTILAAICSNMNRMAEYRAARFKIDLFHGVTTGTTILETKGRFTIMAGTAGQPFFHVRHAETLTYLAGPKNPIMAVGTLEQTPMTLVTKHGDAGFLNLEGYSYG